MIAEVYDALREAGASEERSRAAAETLASYDDRFNRIEHRLQLLQWQLGALIAVIVPAGTGMLWLLLRVASKVGALS
jgi:hypothetical protein